MYVRGSTLLKMFSFSVDCLMYSSLLSNQLAVSCTHIDHINVCLICDEQVKTRRLSPFVICNKCSFN